MTDLENICFVEQTGYWDKKKGVPRKPDFRR